jgi:hypothetical protein
MLVVTLINLSKPVCLSLVNTLSIAEFVKETTKTRFYIAAKILIKTTIAVVLPDPGVPNTIW